MGSRILAWAALLGSTVIFFAVAVAVGLRLTPPPRSETDYLVIGSVATLLALVVLFTVLLTTWLRTSGVFFKRRPKPPVDDHL